jgi:predicted Rossmann-fold nucleotide-binding protein
MTPLLYVAGRYRAATREAVAANIEAARQVGIQAARLGWYPVIPHCNTAHMELDVEHGDQFWLAGTLELMTRCDAVVLVPGWEISQGTLGEIAKADQLQLPIYRSPHLLPSAGAFLAWLHACGARRA